MNVFRGLLLATVFALPASVRAQPTPSPSGGGSLVIGTTAGTFLGNTITNAIDVSGGTGGTGGNGVGTGKGGTGGGNASGGGGGGSTENGQTAGAGGAGAPGCAWIKEIF